MILGGGALDRSESLRVVQICAPNHEDENCRIRSSDAGSTIFDSVENDWDDIPHDQKLSGET
jgi:hypothetical protein